MLVNVNVIMTIKKIINKYGINIIVTIKIIVKMNMVGRSNFVEPKPGKLSSNIWCIVHSVGWKVLCEEILFNWPGNPSLLTCWLLSNWVCAKNYDFLVVYHHDALEEENDDEEEEENYDDDEEDENDGEEENDNADDDETFCSRHLLPLPHL